MINFRKWVSKGRPKDDDNSEWINHKNSKKAFRKELKFVQKEFDRKELDSILASAEYDKNKFWRLIKKSRKPLKSCSHAVKNKDDVVVHDLPSVVKVWKEHFTNLSTEKHDTRFDKAHYKMVTENVKTW